LNSIPIITDTHLYYEEFDEDRDEMIQRAIDIEITRFFIPAIGCGIRVSYFY
jgi:TatD DNase family protein